ncbi:MAG: 3-hydroxybutyryl-CoA dehydrogenase [Candidatus Kapabacteria bacterium]|nr:3-hydroxybutyryl-CoA dehydrogenase [Candidatus Kapabacteria bacterium]
MIQSIVVIGAGTMGNGISHVFAQYGYKVTIVDIAQSSLDKGLTNITNNLSRQVKKGTLTEDQMSATLANISLSTDLASVAPKANLIIEAASEDINVKKKIFTQLDAICPDTTIFATNTSSISITDLAAVTKRADKFIGMHFFNPVPVMKLVELIRGIATSNETHDVIHSLSLAIEKVPVSVQDYPGFISNRVLMPMINEAIYCLMEGVASAEDIDTVMKLGMAHPMGPLTLADFIGLDVCLAIMEVLHNGYSDSKYRPCPLLRKMVAAGYMGRKSGKGFFTY